MWASRFYGLDVPPDVELREELTDRGVADLVDAYLGINYSYFGAIDKTLAGFVVLADDGDDYTLWDLRDTGQVFWQDHETRQVSLRHDSLAGYLARAEAKGERPTARAISTAALCARYQWLVWFLARPLTQDGVATQTVDYLVRCGIGHFRSTWPTRDAAEQAFVSEAPSLATDPHLAIYWLLHATALADDDLRARARGDRRAGHRARARVRRPARPAAARGRPSDRARAACAARARSDVRVLRAYARDRAPRVPARARGIAAHELARARPPGRRGDREGRARSRAHARAHPRHDARRRARARGARSQAWRRLEPAR